MGVGTLINPLNSSMLAVVLVTLRDDFSLSVPEVTWIVTVFYLTSAVAQPLMGRIADVAGPRRAFVGGMAIVAVASAVAPFAPSFVALCAARVLIGFGSSAALPSALSIIRRRADHAGGTPMAAIAQVQLGNSFGVVLGPAIGGIVVSIWHWGVIFWLGVPLSLLAMVAVLIMIEPDPALETRGARALITALDLPSVGAFAAMIIPFLVLLSGTNLVWSLVLAVVTVTSGVLLVGRSRRLESPFIDLSLVTSGRLLHVYVGFWAMTATYYCVFYGLPQYLEGGLGLDAGEVGMLLVPLAGVSVVANPVISRALLRYPTRSVLLIGALWMIFACCLLLLLAAIYDPVLVVLICAALGVPYGISTLGYAKATYDVAPAAKIGVATGMLQTCRHVGGSIAMIVLSLVFSGGLRPRGLVALVVALVVGCLIAVYVATIGWRTASQRGDR